MTIGYFTETVGSVGFNMNFPDSLFHQVKTLFIDVRIDIQGKIMDGDGKFEVLPGVSMVTPCQLIVTQAHLTEAVLSGLNRRSMFG